MKGFQQKPRRAKNEEKMTGGCLIRPFLSQMSFLLWDERKGQESVFTSDWPQPRWSLGWWMTGTADTYTAPSPKLVFLGSALSLPAWSVAELVWPSASCGQLLCLCRVRRVDPTDAPEAWPPRLLIGVCCCHFAAGRRGQTGLLGTSPGPDFGQRLGVQTVCPKSI